MVTNIEISSFASLINALVASDLIPYPSSISSSHNMDSSASCKQISIFEMNSDELRARHASLKLLATEPPDRIS